MISQFTVTIPKSEECLSVIYTSDAEFRPKVASFLKKLAKNPKIGFNDAAPFLAEIQDIRSSHDGTI